MHDYPSKPLADQDTADRRAARRYAQGNSHARQGRTDLYGQCPHYDAGFDAEQDAIHSRALDAVTFTVVA